MRNKQLAIFLVMFMLLPIILDINVKADGNTCPSGWQIIDEKGAWINKSEGKARFRKTASAVGTEDRVNITRKINKDDNSIHWTIQFVRGDEKWPNGIQHVVYLPQYETISKITRTYRNPKNGVGKDEWSVDEFNYQHSDEGRWHSKVGETGRWKEVDMWRSIIQYAKGEIGEYLTYLRDTRKFSMMLRGNERPSNEHCTWTFTTYHKAGENLEKVPCLAKVAIRNWDHQSVTAEAIAPFGDWGNIDLKYDRDFWVVDKNNLTEQEKNALYKEIKEDAKINGDKNKLKSELDNATATYRKDGDKHFVTINYPDCTSDEIDVTKNIKEKRKIIPGSESNIPELKNEWVSKEYVKMKLDAKGGNLLSNNKGKAPENFYYVLKGATIKRKDLPETAEKKSHKFKFWSKDGDGIEEKEKHDLFTVNGAKQSENDIFEIPTNQTEFTIYAVYRQNLKIVLHNNLGDGKDVTEDIPVNLDDISDGKVVVKIYSPFYNNNKSGTTTELFKNKDSFKKKDHNFVGWTLDKNGDKIEFGPHIKNNANFSINLEVKKNNGKVEIIKTPNPFFNKYTYNELKAGLKKELETDTKKSNKYKEPAYLPWGFDFVLEGTKEELAKIADENNGVINLYANYRPLINVVAEKEYKNYDWDTKTYSDLEPEQQDKKKAVRMGLIYRTAVTTWSNPTVHDEANYHILRPMDFGGSNNVDEEQYNNYVLKQYDPSKPNDKPTWKVPGFDEYGLRRSYALVEVPETKNYSGFANNWANLGIKIFARIPGISEGENDSAPVEPNNPKLHVSKLQYVSIKGNDEKIDAYAAATCRTPHYAGDKKDQITGYTIKVYNMPVDIKAPNIDPIYHGDKEFTIRYDHNPNEGASNVNRIKINWGTNGYTLNLNGETWNVTKEGDHSGPTLVAKFPEKSGQKDKTRLIVSLEDSNLFFKNDGTTTDKFAIENIKVVGGKEQKSRQTNVTVKPIIDANELQTVMQLHNRNIEGKEYTIVEGTLPTPTLNESGAGSAFVLVEKSTFDDINQKQGEERQKALEAWVKKNVYDGDGSVKKSNTIYDLGTLGLESGGKATFKIPISESESMHDKEYVIVSVEPHKNSVICKKTVTLDTKAEITEFKVKPGKLNLKMDISGTINSLDFMDGKEVQIIYDNESKSIRLDKNTFDFKNFLPKANKYTLEYEDKFGNKATKDATIEEMIDQVEVSVVRPQIASNILYINGISEGYSVSVSLIRNNNSIATVTVTNGKAVFNNQKFEKNDRLKVEVTKDNIVVSNPYVVVVR